MPGHIKTIHLKEWLATQPKRSGLNPAVHTVHRLPSSQTLNVPPLSKPSPLFKAVAVKTPSRQQPRQSVVNVAPVPAYSGAPVQSVARTAMENALRAVGIRNSATGGSFAQQPVLPVPEQRKSARLERRRAASYSLQLSRVSVLVSSRPFDGALHPESSPPLRTSGTLALPSSMQGKATVECSCGGENHRCFRCDGRGYYDVSPAVAARLQKQPVVRAATGSGAIASFAVDARGGEHVMRELGKFASLPGHDDYDDESFG